jgi:hypothetical protein
MKVIDWNIYKNILSSNISKSAKLIYFNMLSYAGYRNGIFPSITKIQRDIKINRRQSIIDGIHELESIGVLKVNRDFGKSNTYKLTGFKIVTGHEIETTPVSKSLPTGHEIETLKGKEKEDLKGIVKKKKQKIIFDESTNQFRLSKLLYELIL